MWELATDLSKTKQGPVLYLSLSDKACRACASLLTKEVLSAEDGLAKLVEKLRELYGTTPEQAQFNAYTKSTKHLGVRRK